ncbi:hypothetical protein L195_g030181 [Trifolium pratense]|uniref:Uncharacterized protein n=1 Tax=Trifolium pratense TaxID=57577 RepID=A0A2K3L6V4_TRIPR|nr:hypothetical protein L195_g030181 [Trifolium pratense]
MEKAAMSSQSFGNSIETGTLWRKSGLVLGEEYEGIWLDVVIDFRGFCGGYGVGFDEGGVDENGNSFLP